MCFINLRFLQPRPLGLTLPPVPLLARPDRAPRHVPGGFFSTVLAVSPDGALVSATPGGVLGGITVLTGLSPLVVGAHFLLSIVLVALCTVLVQRAGEPAVEGAENEVSGNDAPRDGAGTRRGGR